jgi:hypothetical protein
VQEQADAHFGPICDLLSFGDGTTIEHHGSRRPHDHHASQQVGGEADVVEVQVTAIALASDKPL